MWIAFLCDLHRVGQMLFNLPSRPFSASAREYSLRIFSFPESFSLDFRGEHWRPPLFSAIPPQYRLLFLILLSFYFGLSSHYAFRTSQDLRPNILCKSFYILSVIIKYKLLVTFNYLQPSLCFRVALEDSFARIRRPFLVAKIGTDCPLGCSKSWLDPQSNNKFKTSL